MGVQCQAVQSADCLGCVNPNRSSLGVQSQAVQSADCLDTYGCAFLPTEIRLGVKFRLCSLEIVWILMGVFLHSFGGTVPGCVVCRLFGHVWRCISSNRNSFGGTIPPVQSVDCLDMYGGVSPFVWGNIPRLCSLQISWTRMEKRFSK